MITLLTGAPGAGKTAELVNLLVDLADERPLFVHGLNGLRLPHTVVDASQWHRDLPDGAVLVVDEVQQVWRPRGPSHAAPESVQALETHRHRGIDVFLTTQQPKLLDSNVRALVGRHIHLRDTGWLGRWRYEWPECSENLAWKTCSLKKRFKLPRRSFPLYKSATEHTKVQRGRSLVPYVAGGALLVFAWLAWMVVGIVTGAGDEPAAPAVASPAVVAASPTANRGGQADDVTAASLHRAFTPRIANVPNTAPAYDEMRKVVAMPRIMGGYCQGGHCRCYIQNAQRAPITHEACAAWVADPPFDPYHVEQRSPAWRDASGADAPAGASSAPSL
jgi:zona occludens toxin